MSDVARWHEFVCHADGSACEDGCDKAAIPNRQADYERYASLTGAEKLRSIVAWIDYQRESFNDRFTALELVALWEHEQRNAHRLAEFADTWDERDVLEALRFVGK